MSELPSGTVTFLFTDIEGSTRLLRELGEDYDRVLAEHRRVLRDAFERHGGVEVDTQGDAFFVSFARASDAAAAAAAAQDALASTPVRVRMGIHTGEPRTTEEGYAGIDVHRAARIGNAANGGQIVISPTTRQLLDEDAELKDLGEHRLKDFSAATRLFQLGTTEFPPLRTPDEARLPAAATHLVGRKKELSDALRLVREERVRLVTVTGPPGVGKTRFAIEVAVELLEQFTDGARFVDLALLRLPAGVLPAIGQAVRARAGVEEALRDQQVLLILDNAEHVAAAAPELGSLLEACPDLSLLITSREPLHLALERELPLRPMPEAPAVELFRQRAQRVDPNFKGNYALLAEICRRLDGLPLAIELAAARVKLFAPEALLDRLDQRLSLLTGRGRDLPERHRTLRAAIEWSYDLLEDEERRAFASLGVFVGPFSIEAAEEVAAVGVDTLESLVDKSLLTQAEGRLSMLGMLRDLALERLDESGATREVRQRHAAHFIGLAEVAAPYLEGPEQQRWFDALEVELANLREARGTLQETLDIEGEARLAAALWRFTWVRGYWDEGRAMLEAAAGHGGLPSELRIRVLEGLAQLVFRHGDLPRLQGICEEGLQLAHELGDTRAGARLSRVAAAAERDAGRARRLREEALELAIASGDEWSVSIVKNDLGSDALDDGDFVLAAELLDEARSLARARGDKRSMAITGANLGNAYLGDGQTIAAREALAEALRSAASIGYREIVAIGLLGLAALAAEEGDAARAARLLGAGLEIVERDGITLEGYERTQYDRARARAENALGPAFEAEIQAGRELGVAQAVQHALGEPT